MAQGHRAQEVVQMTAGSFKDIEKLEADLWEAADNLRADAGMVAERHDAG